MKKFIPDIIEPETIAVKKFTTVEEGVGFVLNLINKQAHSIEEIYKYLLEENLRGNSIIYACVHILCEKLSVYGMQISYDDLIKEAKSEVNKNWPRIKKEVAEIRAARKAAIDELIDSVQTSAQEEDKTNKEDQK